jgi:hypothetical protein
MGHCEGGIGPNSFGNDRNRFAGDPERDLITALERWVEKESVRSGLSAREVSLAIRQPP